MNLGIYRPKANIWTHDGRVVGPTKRQKVGIVVIGDDTKKVFSTKEAAVEYMRNNGTTSSSL